MEIFFIGDTHFGHNNILKYEPIHRDFACIEDHDNELVNRWNFRVTERDTVYHLGDFCFGKHNIHIASHLRGIKKLILGNHDVYDVLEYKKYFHKIYGVLQYKEFLLSHMPTMPSDRFQVNIHGHLHSKVLLTDRPDKYINVSCEQINLTPISLDEINIIRYKRSEFYK